MERSAVAEIADYRSSSMPAYRGSGLEEPLHRAGPLSDDG